MARTYYCFCDDDCKFPTMTAEQIIAAIAEATGNTPTNIDDAFISKIKDANASRNLTFWAGTEAEFNALNVSSLDVICRIDENGKLYLVSGLEDLTYKQILLMMNPVVTIVTNITGVNPSDYIGGTWELYSKGRTIYGVDPDDADFSEAGITGGEKTHTLTKAELPDHTHVTKDYFMDASQYNKVSYGTDLEVRAGTKHTDRSSISSDCGGEAHNNMPPYITAYVWLRTA